MSNLKHSYENVMLDVGCKIEEKHKHVWNKASK